MGVTEPVSKSLPQTKSENVPTADRKAIIKEFKEAMDRGDERAALRAEAKYRRIDIKAEKNIYDYSPNDPDPTIDYYFEPPKPRRTGKVRPRRQTPILPERRRSSHQWQRKPAHTKWHDRFACANKASRRTSRHSHPPQPLRRQEQEAHHPQPITSKSLSLWERARVRVNPYPSSPSMPTPVLPPRML